MTVIKSRGEFLEADLEGEQREDAATIVRWSEGRQGDRPARAHRPGDADGRGVPPRGDGARSGTRGGDRPARTDLPEVSFDVSVPDAGHRLSRTNYSATCSATSSRTLSRAQRDGRPRIRVTVTDEDDHRVVRIADNGRGVDDEHKEAIFRRDETGHAKSVGSGFGLFFVDAMMTEYGGAVDVEDNDDDGPLSSSACRLPVTASVTGHRPSATTRS